MRGIYQNNENIHNNKLKNGYNRFYLAKILIFKDRAMKIQKLPQKSITPPPSKPL